MKVNLILLSCLAVMLLLVGVVASVHAETTLVAADPQITWYSVGGGGGYVETADGLYALDSTSAQPTTGVYPRQRLLHRLLFMDFPNILDTGLL